MCVCMCTSVTCAWILMPPLIVTAPPFPSLSLLSPLCMSIHSALCIRTHIRTYTQELLHVSPPSSWWQGIPSSSTVSDFYYVDQHAWTVHRVTGYSASCCWSQHWELSHAKYQKEWPAYHTLTFLPLFLEAPEEVAAYVTPSRAGKREHLGNGGRQPHMHTQECHKDGVHLVHTTLPLPVHIPKITKPDKIGTAHYQFQRKLVGAQLAVSFMVLAHNYMWGICSMRPKQLQYMYIHNTYTLC